MPDNLSILLVEDEFLIALDAEQALSAMGANVEVLSTYEEAERRARDGQFELAVLDVNLNGRVSFPIAQIIRQRGIPVILASGYALEQRALEGLDGVLCVAKPYSPARLAEAVHAALRQTEQTRDG